MLCCLSCKSCLRFFCLWLYNNILFVFFCFSQNVVEHISREDINSAFFKSMLEPPNGVDAITIALLILHKIILLIHYLRFLVIFKSCPLLGRGKTSKRSTFLAIKGSLGSFGPPCTRKGFNALIPTIISFASATPKT